MIIVRLIGGLGNQMFQYAAARRLADLQGTDLFLDAAGYSRDPLRFYDLDIFAIDAAIAPEELLKRVLFPGKKFLGRIQNLLTRETGIRYIAERSPEFDERICTLPDNSYLDGYWQSEKYFKKREETLRKEFSFVSPPSTINRELMKKMEGDHSVSIHIRRGDYTSDAETRKTHYVCDEEYYRKALLQVMEKVNNPEFFIFSDDPDWAEEYITPDAPVTYITHNRERQSHEDLRLMIACRHHVIANSSFSWWGAWLGKKPGQVVLAPARWFVPEYLSSKDKYPDGWIKI